MAELQIEQWAVDQLIPYARNPRQNDAQVDRMAGAIREFGFRIPIVARSDGTVVDGHLRLKAAQKLGMETVPVVLADELSEAQVKAFRLLANKSVEWADWDWDLLRCEIEELAGTGFDVELTGFNLDEVQRLQPEPPAPVGGDSLVPERDDNIQVRLSFHPGLWLGKREEVMGIIAKMEKAYDCKVKVDE